MGIEVSWFWFLASSSALVVHLASGFGLHAGSMGVMAVGVLLSGLTVLSSALGGLGFRYCILYCSLLRCYW